MTEIDYSEVIDTDGNTVTVARYRNKQTSAAEVGICAWEPSADADDLPCAQLYLSPDEAVKLAHRLLTLAHQVGAEIAE